MYEIIKVFRNLNEFSNFTLLDYDKIDEIYENSIENSQNIALCVDRIPAVEVARTDPLVLSNLLELCTVIRSVRESNTGYDNTYDCWDRVVEVSPRERYLMFVYTIVGLANYDPKNKIYRKLSMATASTYFLSLTIPGSKGFHIFDGKIISRCLEVFQLIETIRNDAKLIIGQDRIEIWVNFMNFCDDLKLMFRYVHFDEYKDIRNLIIWELVKVLYNNHVNGFENIYAANFHSKCFEIFEEIINAHNGDPEETLMKIMKMSFILHTHQPTPKFPKNGPDSCSQFCAHISDWFSAIISKYPGILTKVLNCYIQCVVINPEKSWRTEQHQRALDYAAKYDSQLYIKCNESILPQLSDMLRAEDVQIRQNAIELCNRIVLIESKVNWEVFLHEISNVPREVFAIKEILIRLRDVNNVIKLKALHGLNQAYIKGNENSKKIITEGIRFSTYNDTEIFLPTEPRIRKKEVRYSRPKQIEPSYTYEGHEIIQPYFNELPNIIYGLWNCQNGFVRKAAIAMIEPMVILNPHIIYNTNFVKKCISLSHDPIALVRKQALQMIDNILDNYPNCFPIVWAWCNVIAPLFEDVENKNNELSWECFKRRVIDNIKGFDKTNIAEQLTPWIIIRVLLSSQNRHYLQTCITEVAKKEMLNQQVLGFIESHTLTSNSTEAWTLLNFVSGNMKCKQPDSLISIFIKSMLDQTWNAGQNLQLILEVLSKCVKDFSHSALNVAFSCIIKLMKEGAIPPTIIGKSFDFCMTIHMQSEGKRSNENDRNPTSIKSPNLNWVEDIHKVCENYLIQNLNNFYSNKTKFVSYLFSYSETNLELLIRPNQNIINFILNGIKEHINIPENDYDSEDVNTLNQFIILSARLSIRDANIASDSCLLYSLILKKIDRPQIISTVLIALTDLCKRHTQTVELTLGNILHKLKSSYVENRLETFRNLSGLILQDQLKLRGNVLLGLITIMLDENDALSNRAIDFFHTYIEKKNSILFQTCLLECPFVYNEYMSFDGFETFSDIEIQSPLKGDHKLNSRHQLYNAFMLKVDEINLLMYFDNIKLIYGKIQSDSSIKSAEGFAMIKDILYILKNICENVSDKFLSKNTESGENVETFLLNDASTSKTDKANMIEKSKRGKRNIHTLQDGMATIEKNLSLIPKLSKILIQWDTSFEKLLNDLNIAICKKFGNLVLVGQPAEFWNNYKPDKGETSKQKNIEVEKQYENQDLLGQLVQNTEMKHKRLKINN